jgi:phosphoribosylglycinamide formyltransferase-1
VANLAVLASGGGTNFQAIAEALACTRHSLACLVTDKKNAYALARAEKLGIPSRVVSYGGKSRRQAEEEILAALAPYRIDYIALAGFMRLLTPFFVDAYPSRIINIHPALLPKYPGAHGIRESYESGDRHLGITIHYVDYGLDSGPVILQQSFIRNGAESIDEIEACIHRLEHTWYPKVVIDLLDAVRQETTRQGDRF